MADIGYGVDGFGESYDGYTVTLLEAWEVDLERSLFVFKVEGFKQYIDANPGAPTLFVNAIPATIAPAKDMRVDFTGTGFKFYRENVLVTTI